MANQYIWDLGFDFNAVQDNNTLSFLQNGFVLVNPDTVPVPASPADLNPGDTVGFNVFNLTYGATAGATADEYSILGGMITFTYATANQVGTPCPFSPLAPVQNGIGLLPPIQLPYGPDGGTAIISFGPCPAHAPQPSAIFSGLQRKVSFPWWPVVLGMPLENVDGFLMTVALTVEGPGPVETWRRVQRTFVVDPEMIVGSAG